MDRRLEGRNWSSVFGARACILLLVCVGVALTLGVVGPAASSGPSFAGPRNYATGFDPNSVAIGDLNGDGKLDLATANGKAISVLINRGNGSFQAKRDYQAQGYAVAIGDLNGDGKPDLAIPNGETRNTVSVLLNLGDGSFGANLDYPTGASPESVAIGDVNADGKLDLVAANHYTDTVSVLLNNGDGSFQTKRDYRTAENPNAVAIGDLNGDGKPDLATVMDLDTVSVLLNNGDGSFQARRDYATGPGPNAVAIGDLNGDRKPDVVAADVGFAGNTVSVLLNRGDGGLQAKRDYRVGGANSVAIGDLNGDRKPDLATANGNNEETVSVLANRGDGSFQPKLDYRNGAGAISIAIGDLNRDGKLDLVTANSETRTVSVLLNRPGLCTVQDVRRMTLPSAKRTIERAYCHVGNVRRSYSAVKKGRVISQKPKAGAVLPDGSKVNLVVSRGRRR